MVNLSVVRRGHYLVPLLLSFAFSASAVGVSGQGTWETTLKPRDINGDSTVDAYYDTDLDVTWLADWNVQGANEFAQANAWAESLSVYGVSGWRLPRTVDDESSCCFNVSPDSSELAHMFYVTLGNVGSPSPGQNNLTNTADFRNIQADYYWSGTVSTIFPGTVWFSGMHDGAAGAGTPLYTWFAVAVHDGDIASVPEPRATLLFLAGAVLLGFHYNRLSSRKR